ncbi:MAG: response regulator [Halobacteriales archaeon]|nr:response regulator [Halobacteriales archaeon]
MTDEIWVLHVDDEEDFVETTTTFLERRYDRFVVEAATEAREALDRLSEEGFDCVVSDYEMPDMNGIELLEAVQEEYDEIPFILFTGRGNEEIASEAISAGVTDYLRKRGSAEQYTILANRIVKAVETARAKAEARRNQKRFESLSEAFPDVAFYIDEEGR